jgi:hypothetical protein
MPLCSPDQHTAGTVTGCADSMVLKKGLTSWQITIETTHFEGPSVISTLTESSNHDVV